MHWCGIKAHCGKLVRQWREEKMSGAVFGLARGKRERVDNRSNEARRWLIKLTDRNDE